jgi:hypothetical protein
MMIDPDDELRTRQGTLKGLIGSMNDRIARQDLKAPKGVDISVSVQPVGEDDLEGLEPDMAELIRSKRAGA